MAKKGKTPGRIYKGVKVALRRLAKEEAEREAKQTEQSDQK